MTADFALTAECERLLPAVSDYPRFDFSKKEVLRAGEALKGELPWTPETREQVVQIFRIAYNWRDSHAYPMQCIRQELSGKMRTANLEGIAVARLKRMPSIRKKLRVHSGNLSRMQDLGGCRAILPAMADVRTLVAKIRETSRHELHREYDYITDPKPGGYRCHHLVYEFVGDARTAVYNTRRIEIQIRTRLQHAWATAVEAVGLFRNEDMKGGNGDADWLRLFDLVSSEFALVEKCPESAHVPPQSERLVEIKELEHKLSAVQFLEELRFGMRETDPVNNRIDKADHYRIEYDHDKKTVRISRHSKPIVGIASNNLAEQADSEGKRNINTVYVEADKIDDLKAAYPNYFGDVQVFSTSLRNIAQGKGTTEFTMAPRVTVPPPPREPADFTWLRPGSHRKWHENSGPSKKPRK